MLKLLLKREAFLKYSSSVDYEYLKESCKELYHLYNTHRELHAEFPDRDFSVAELSAYFYSKYPDVARDVYDSLLEQVNKAEISDDVGQAILTQIKRRKILLKLSERAYEASQGRAELGELQGLFGSFDKPELLAVEADTFITTDLEALVANTYAKPGIRFPLDCLNKSLGSLRKGDFGFIFARPETGKTTILAAVAAGALDQVSDPVVWFNNEETDSKVVLRVIQSYFGITLMELMGNLQHYNKLFNEKVGKKFRFVNSAKVDIDKANVERILAQTSPSLIIYDQIDKIKGFKADRDDLALGSIYQWARELAKKYAPSIGVCQADGSGEGQKWLTMGNVANAKTSKQAEADFILGIGKISDEASEFIRYFNISKNKLQGDEDSIPRLRHGRFETIIEPELARYKDIVKYE